VRASSFRVQRVMVITALVLAAVLMWPKGGGPDRADAAGTAAASSRRPNIVTIMTDDQTVESLRVMPGVRSLIAKKGVSFANSIVSWPLCCPSRATYFTGQYAHNHGVRGNVPPEGGYSAFKNQKTTFPVALQNAGYDTVHIGKYLNGYGAEPNPSVPPGWSEWHGSLDPTGYRYYGYTLLENGKKRTYGKKAADYQTDRYTRLATSVIRRAERERPFFLNVSYLAPHNQARSTASGDSDLIGQAVAAPRHAGRYGGMPLPRSRAYDEADVSDKPEFVQTLPRITEKIRSEISKSYDVYLESLLAVDDGVRRIVRTLKETGQLDNTVIIFTSDNGFFFGEHRITSGKVFFYEPSIRVPLMMRGPGIPADVTRKSLVANIDLAPTILDLAHATPLRTMDGQSLVPLLHQERSPDDRAILLEGSSAWLPNFGVRTPRYAYFSYNTGEHELYDLPTDPDELRNLHGDPALASVQADLEVRRERLAGCVGAECNVGSP
jgi:N-acetylglucosamine-6-sulfatase